MLLIYNLIYKYTHKYIINNVIIIVGYKYRQHRTLNR